MALKRADALRKIQKLKEDLQAVDLVSCDPALARQNETSAAYDATRHLQSLCSEIKKLKRLPGISPDQMAEIWSEAWNGTNKLSSASQYMHAMVVLNKLEQKLTLS